MINWRGGGGFQKCIYKCPRILFLGYEFCHPGTSLHSTRGGVWQAWKGSAFTVDFPWCRQGHVMLYPLAWLELSYPHYPPANRSSCYTHLILRIFFFLNYFNWYARDLGLKQSWEISSCSFYDTISLMQSSVWHQRNRVNPFSLLVFPLILLQSKRKYLDK